MKNKVTYFKQLSENECGLCCIAMIESYFGNLKPINYFRNRLRIGRDGMSLYDITSFLEGEGLKCNTKKKTALEKSDIQKSPTLIFVNDHHFIVAISDKEKIICYDSKRGKYRITISELNTIYSGYIQTYELTQNFEISPEKLRSFRHIANYLLKVKHLFLVVSILSILSYLLVIVIPLMIKQIVDSIAQIRVIQFDIIWIQILFVTLLFYILSHLRNKFAVILSKRLLINISSDIIYNLSTKNYSYYDNRSQGDVLYRLNLMKDIQNVISTEMINICMTFSSSFIVFIYIVVNYSVIGFISLFILVLIAVYIVKNNKKFVNIKKKELGSKLEADKTITDIINFIFQIKSMHLMNYFTSNYDRNLITYSIDFEMTQKFILKYNLFTNIIFIFSPILMIFIYTFTNNMSINEFGNLFVIYSLTSTLFSQSYSLVSQLNSLYSIKSSLDYINDFLDEPSEKFNSSIAITEPFESLCFNEVSFKYNEFGKEILSEINFDIKCGEIKAIVGESGSGKTTLVKLLAGLYSPSNGKILFNGVDIQSLNKDDLYQQISIIAQNPIYLNKSIRENICLGKSITDIELVNVLKKVNLYDMVNEMPLKMNTIISGTGGNLSTGQVQRLSIARAIINKPQLLVLDESTSSLDYGNEMDILKKLCLDGLALLIITHRTESILNVNEIMRIENTKLIHKVQIDDLKLLNKKLVQNI
ncbi:MAG: ATP-binding cassette domain-containing protein [Erysipelotrichaceae bacterium]